LIEGKERRRREEIMINVMTQKAVTHFLIAVYLEAFQSLTSLD